MHDTRFMYSIRQGEGVVKRNALVGMAALFTTMLTVGAGHAQIFEQKYLVEAQITPLKGDEPTITVSEVWETIVYRDATRHDLVRRVFGEALHFEYEGADYFALKRGYNGSSAGAFDPLRECLG
jgi:hypothetical protein